MAHESLGSSGQAGVKKRAKFKLSEITRTNRGISIVRATIVHDPQILRENALGTGSIPKGELTFETDESFAASLPLNDCYFYLTVA